MGETGHRPQREALNCFCHTLHEEKMMRNRSNKKKKMKEPRRRYHSSRSQKNTRTKERARKIGRGGIGEDRERGGKESSTRTDTDGDVVRRSKI